MKRVKVNQGSVLVCGLSSGDIEILGVDEQGLKTIAKIKLAHDFGVNSLDVKLVNGDHLCIVSGGDDQQISILLVRLSDGTVI